MKTKNTKTMSTKKSAKKAAKKQLEQSLTEKFLEAVKGLGHNAEVIGADVAKAGKAVAKKLFKTFAGVKQAVEHKIDDMTSPAENTNVKVKTAKKDSKKLLKNTDKSADKIVKKAVKRAAPAVSSVKVEALASEEKVAKAVKAPAKNAGTTAKPRAKTTAGQPKPVAVKKTTRAVPQKEPAKPGPTQAKPNKAKSAKANTVK